MSFREQKDIKTERKSEAKSAGPGVGLVPQVPWMDNACDLHPIVGGEFWNDDSVDR